MDRQATFNQVFHALAKQGERAVGAKGSCAYRTTDGKNKVLKCGIGHIIADEDYNADMENMSVGQLIYPLLRGKANPIPAYIRKDWVENMEFLRDIQATHDCSYDGPTFVAKTIELANKYKLEIPAELADELSKVVPTWL